MRRTENADICEEWFSEVKLGTVTHSPGGSITWGVGEAEVGDGKAKDDHLQQRVEVQLDIPPHLDQLDLPPNHQEHLHQDNLQEKRRQNEHHHLYLIRLGWLTETLKRGEAGEGQHKEESDQKLDIEEYLDPLPLLEDEALKERVVEEEVPFLGIQLNVGEEI